MELYGYWRGRLLLSEVGVMATFWRAACCSGSSALWLLSAGWLRVPAQLCLVAPFWRDRLLFLQYGSLAMAA